MCFRSCQEVRVGAKGKCRCRMAQPLLHDLNRDSTLKEMRSVGVSKVVEGTTIRESQLLAQTVEVTLAQVVYV